MTLLDEHRSISETIRKADGAYHAGDAPIMSDGEYDSLKSRLIEIERGSPELAIGSPSGTVGAKPRSGFAEVVHDVRMMSLDNAFSDEDVREFVVRIGKATGSTNPKFIAEPKIDGLSLSVRFEGGRLVRGATRGDSNIGEDVTDNTKGISGIPHSIPYDDVIEIRGEAYISNPDLIALNRRREAAGEKLYANARNAASGAIRTHDVEESHSRGLRFFAYSVVGGPDFASQEQLLETLHDWGFSVSSEIGICEGADELIAYHAQIGAMRKELPFDIDGVVYKLDDFGMRDRVGETSRAPRWAIAHKFPAEQVTTELHGITLQVGRTGVVTPVAELRPVAVGGVVVSRATLHNAEELERKDVRIGDTVTIQRAGDVIPQVLGPILELRPSDAVAYQFPTECPSCGGQLRAAAGEVAIRCIGSFSCPDQKVERLKYLASRDVLDIEGLGEKAVEVLVKAGLLEHPGDVFRLPERMAEIARLPGMAEKSAQQLAESIRRKSTTSLDRFLTALGIRHIGLSTARLLAARAVSADRFFSDAKAIVAGDAVVTKGYEAIDQVGPAVIEAIAEHFSDPRNMSDARDLLANMRVVEFKISEGPLTGQTVVFTGTLEKFDRKSAKESALKLGAKVSGTVSSRTNLLIAGESAGSKLAEAKKLGVRIVDEAGWIAIVADAEGK